MMCDNCRIRIIMDKKNLAYARFFLSMITEFYGRIAAPSIGRAV